MKKLFRFLSAITVAAVTLTGCGDNAAEKTNESAGNETINSIMTRSSIRTYTDRQVSADTVEILLRAAMAAPTAVNCQPWKFIVIRNKELLATIADSIPNAGDKLLKSSVTILVCGDRQKFLEREPDYWIQDCSAATENLLLAAHSLGLGAVWCGVYPVKDRVAAVSKTLGLDEKGLIPLNLIPVGYPDCEPTIKDKWKPDNIIYVD